MSDIVRRLNVKTTEATRQRAVNDFALLTRLLAEQVDVDSVKVHDRKLGVMPLASVLGNTSIALRNGNDTVFVEADGKGGFRGGEGTWDLPGDTGIKRHTWDRSDVDDLATWLAERIPRFAAPETEVQQEVRDFGLLKKVLSEKVDFDAVKVQDGALGVMPLSAVMGNTGFALRKGDKTLFIESNGKGGFLGGEGTWALPGGTGITRYDWDGSDLDVVATWLAERIPNFGAVGTSHGTTGASIDLA